MLARISIVLLFLTFFVADIALAQYIHPVYRDNDSIVGVQDNTLYFRFQNVNYFKNNEYFGEIIPGYTLPGFDLTPLLVYHPTKTTRIEAGYQFKLLLGENNDMQRASFLRFHWKLREWFSLVLGTLYSQSSHNLPEPIMNPEQSFYALRDEGVQLLIKRKYLEADAWVSWDDFIWFGDEKNEKVWGGLSAKLKLGEGSHRFEIPLYAAADHIGGQIDATANPATTELNVGIGLRYFYSMKGFLKKIEVSSEVYGYATDIPQNYNYFRNRELFFRGAFTTLNGNRYRKLSDLPRAKRIVFNQGLGSLSRMVFYTNHWKGAVAYWYGYNFYSPRGEYVYHSKSPSNGTIQSLRQFVHLHGEYGTKLSKGLKLAIALDAFYLMNEATTDLSMGIYLYFDREFFIGRLKTFR